MKKSLRPPSWRKMDGREIPSVLPIYEPFWERFDPSARTIELGCARGRIPLLLAGQGQGRIFGLDLNQRAVALAREESNLLPPESRPDFVAADASKTPFASARFGRVVIQACLTTIVERIVRQGVIKEAARLLSPGGSLYLAEYGLSPHLERYQKRYEQGLSRGLEEGSFEVFDPDSGKLLFIARHFTGRELKGLITGAGLKVALHNRETFTTRTGHRINGHVLLAYKKGENR